MLTRLTDDQRTTINGNIDTVLRMVPLWRRVGVAHLLTLMAGYLDGLWRDDVYRHRAEARAQGFTDGFRQGLEAGHIKGVADAREADRDAVTTHDQQALLTRDQPRRATERDEMIAAATPDRVEPTRH